MNRRLTRLRNEPGTESTRGGKAEVLPSLALEPLLSRLHPDGKYHILDLGAASGKNVEFFSRFSCKLYIEDIYPRMHTGILSGSRAATDSGGEPLLPFPDSTVFDVVLSWDLFNYLRQDQLQSFTQHLTRFCRQGTLLHSLIGYLKQIPDLPMRFTVVDAGHLLYESRTRAVRACPRHQPRSLNRLLPGFRVLKTYLMRHGYQEYLFEYDPAHSGEAGGGQPHPGHEVSDGTGADFF